MSLLPGPWHAYEQAFSTHNHPTRFWETNVYSEQGMLVGCSVGATEEEANASAALHAAVPELLDALHGIMGLVQLICLPDERFIENHRWIEALRVIAKATRGAR